MGSESSLVGRRIEKIRKTKKLSRQQLADRLGTTYLQVYRVETGAVEISVDDVAEFAGALGVPRGSLLKAAS